MGTWGRPFLQLDLTRKVCNGDNTFKESCVFLSIVFSLTLDPRLVWMPRRSPGWLAHTVQLNLWQPFRGAGIASVSPTILFLYALELAGSR